MTAFQVRLSENVQRYPHIEMIIVSRPSLCDHRLVFL